jgi:putative Mg2+ transporter-C (MgtC) family protein
VDALSQIEAIERIGLSLLAGLLVGLEREWRSKPAGLRTYMLVCEGSALFMIASILLGEQMFAAGQAYDPSRIASTVVQGIGFLAGGVIFTRGAAPKGLTTAAGIWVTAAVGLLIGAGFYVVGFAGVAFAIATFSVIGWLEHRWREGPLPGPPPKRRDHPTDEATPQ